MEAFETNASRWFIKEEDLQALLYHRILTGWAHGEGRDERELLPYLHREYPTRGYTLRPLDPSDPGAPGEYDLVVLDLDQEILPYPHRLSDYRIRHAIELKYERIRERSYTKTRPGSIGDSLYADYVKLTEQIKGRYTVEEPSNRHLVLFNDPESNGNITKNLFRDIDGVSRALSAYYVRNPQFGEDRRIHLDMIHLVLAEARSR